MLDFSTGLFLLTLLINSTIACLFLFLIPSDNDRYQLNALRYFRGYFVFSCLGYFAIATRLYWPVEVSVVISNGLFLTAMYCVVFGLLWRSQKRYHLYKHPALIHIGLLMLVQGVLSHYYPDKPVIRIVLVYINVSAVLLYALSLFYRMPKTSVFGEKLLSLALTIAVTCELVLPIAFFATNDFQVFLSLLLVMQNLLVMLLFGSIFYIMFFDSLLMYKQSASVDPTTGLYNRRYFFEQANMFIHAAERHEFPISIIVCEVDHFTSLNDKYGYFAGDEIVHQVARIIVHQTRNEDLVARYGDKDFVILLPQTRLNGALLIAERMRQGIETSLFFHEDKGIKLTASFGVTFIDTQRDIADSLLAADQALREAKAAGHNCVRHHSQDE